jgi:hypothetical protein
MDRYPEIRIMQNGAGWYWEVVANDREVLARGLSDTHAQARLDAGKVTTDTDTNTVRLVS